ncbi:MAG: endonuclease III [Chloroflexi bacterium]|nr:endonuclease III [Chloroflexota bacterium]MBA3850872.1 endonuclease III [Chloroflexota bacterium]
MAEPVARPKGRKAAVRTAPSRRSAVVRRKRKPADPALAWARRLARYRPGLVDDTRAAMRAMYGTPTWRRVHDPTSELVLTILSQNSADINAEKAFDALRAHFPSVSAALEASRVNRPGWGGTGIEGGAPPDWSAVENAPIEELIDVIRPGGLAPQKAPRIQASLRALREARGDYSLEFLGELPPMEAVAWLTAIGGIGRKTASVVLLFCFGTPLMPVDRHVERVAKRIGLVPPKVDLLLAHDMFLHLLEPDQMYEGHVNLITHGRQTCHARKPACHRCAVAPRCRYVDPKAP